MPEAGVTGYSLPPRGGAQVFGPDTMSEATGAAVRMLDGIGARAVHDCCTNGVPIKTLTSRWKLVNSHHDKLNAWFISPAFG
jgi:hypothetical protein